MAERHVLFTGPIDGTVYPDHPDLDEVDVTAPYLVLDDQERAQSVAEAIADEHRARGTHPEQTPEHRAVMRAQRKAD